MAGTAFTRPFESLRDHPSTELRDHPSTELRDHPSRASGTVLRQAQEPPFDLAQGPDGLHIKARQGLEGLGQTKPSPDWKGAERVALAMEAKAGTLESP